MIKAVSQSLSGVILGHVFIIAFPFITGLLCGKGVLFPSHNEITLAILILSAGLVACGILFEFTYYSFFIFKDANIIFAAKGFCLPSGSQFIKLEELKWRFKRGRHLTGVYLCIKDRWQLLGWYKEGDVQLESLKEIADTSKKH